MSSSSIVESILIRVELDYWLAPAMKVRFLNILLLFGLQGEPGLQGQDGRPGIEGFPGPQVSMNFNIVLL